MRHKLPLKNLALQGLLAVGIAALGPAHAATFFTVVPLAGKATAAPEQPIVVTLGAAELPEAMVGAPYSYDFVPHLQVTGDHDFDAKTAVWASSGELPAGLTLSPSGLLSGQPDVKRASGVGIPISATYKGKAGEQLYTLVINGHVLQATKVAGSALSNTACAITPAGGVKCWGYNARGEMGGGSADVFVLAPVDVPGLATGVTDLVVGGAHACAIQNGSMLCWGSNAQGQLGNPGVGSSSSPPVAVQGMHSGVTAMAAGGTFTCAVRSGAAYCWGHNSSGQLGHGPGSPASTNVPQAVYGLDNSVAQIAAGNTHACAIHAAMVTCWGSNNYWQLGHTNGNSSSTPTYLMSLATSGVKSLSLGTTHSCALTEAGGVRCWGSNTVGQLGTSTAGGQSASPQQVSGLSSNVSMITSGSYHNCAIRNGGLWCWGGNSQGQLGQGVVSANVAWPLTVTSLPAEVSNVAAANQSTCAIVNREVSCWGANSTGQLGIGKTSVAEPSPAPVLPH